MSVSVDFEEGVDEVEGDVEEEVEKLSPDEPQPAVLSSATDKPTAELENCLPRSHLRLINPGQDQKKVIKVVAP
jgi:hypothetical protein